MLSIPFEINTEDMPLFYGNKCRYSSMTGVALITPNLLVCTSYCNYQMFLVRFELDKVTYEIIDTISTRGEDGYNGPTDLIRYRRYNDKHEIITSDFQHCSVSLYELNEEMNKITYIRSVTNKGCGHCHGVSFYDATNIIFFTTTGTRNPNCGIYAMSLDDGIPIFGLQEIGWLAKDVTFVDRDTMVGLFCNSAPNPVERRQYSTKIVVYQIDLKKNSSRRLDEVTLPQHHADSCVYRNGKLYVSVEGVNESGRLLVYDISDDGKIVNCNDILGYNFPHGVDISFGILAVTEYGNSTVSLKPLIT